MFEMTAANPDFHWPEGVAVSHCLQSAKNSVLYSNSPVEKKIKCGTETINIVLEN